MTVRAYAVVRDADPFRGPLPAGLGGEPLRLVAADGLAFLCSPALAGEPDTRTVLAFAAIVSALHQMGTILPLRFGGAGAEDQLRAKLGARRTEFLADLERLDGREELTVRLPLADADVEPPRPAPAGTPGTAYLLGRRRRFDRDDARRAAAERIVAGCRARFAGLFSELAHEPAGGAPGTLAVHFLIARGTAPSVAAAVRSASDLFPPTARVFGPWPGYHFLTPPPSALSGG
jgi:hypothetical protein